MFGKIIKAIASIAVIKWATEKLSNDQPKKKSRRGKK